MFRIAAAILDRAERLDAALVSQFRGGVVWRKGPIHLELIDGLVDVAWASEVRLTFQEVVLHPLDVVGARIRVAVQAERPLLSVCFILRYCELVAS